MEKTIMLPNGELFTYYVKSNIDGYEDMNPDEISAINLILTKLPESNDYRIKKTAVTYTTLVYKDYDLLRIRVDKNERSIRIFVPPKNKDKWIDSPLFKNQSNKNQLFWFSWINNLYDYTEVLLDAISFINEQKKEPGN